MSNTGYKYYLKFVDAHTRFTCLCLLKSKSDTLTIFKHLFLTYLSKLFSLIGEVDIGLSLSILQTLYYALTDMSSYHENGIVERKHRHIVEKTLTMLSQASMTLDY